jgi:hypothetical protein
MDKLIGIAGRHLLFREFEFWRRPHQIPPAENRIDHFLFGSPYLFLCLFGMQH